MRFVAQASFSVFVLIAVIVFWDPAPVFSAFIDVNSVFRNSFNSLIFVILDSNALAAFIFKFSSVRSLLFVAPFVFFVFVVLVTPSVFHSESFKIRVIFKFFVTRFGVVFLF
jgi:hypothetical protein